MKTHCFPIPGPSSSLLIIFPKQYASKGLLVKSVAIHSEKKIALEDKRMPMKQMKQTVAALP